MSKPPPVPISLNPSTVVWPEPCTIARQRTTAIDTLFGKVTVPEPIWDGWSPVHRVEAGIFREDNFASRTCDVLPGSDGAFRASLYIPSNPGRSNRVHVFFSAGRVSGDAHNHVTCHALRAAAEESGWILVAVRTPPAPPGAPTDGHPIVTVSADEIRALLNDHGLGTSIDKIRLSSHSRGCFNLKASLQSGDLVASGGVFPVLPFEALDRIVSLDSDAAECNLGRALDDLKIDPGIVFGYHVTAEFWSLLANQTINLMADPVVVDGVKAIEYARLIDDARALRPDLTIPPDMDANQQALGLPALGTLSSRGFQSSGAGAFGGLAQLGAGMLDRTLNIDNVQTFCRQRADAIKKFAGGTNFATVNGFVMGNDLGHTGVNVPVHHQLFACEFAHEITDDAPPQPG